MLPIHQWHTWVQALSNPKAALPTDLRLVVTSGNSVCREIGNDWVARVGQHPRWLHTYGTIETAGIATVYDPMLDTLNPRSPLSIGRPIANIQTYVLDRYLQPAPSGFPGELYIGGAGVSLGYLNRDDRTAARFLPDVFSKQPGSRLYKTGDRVRYLPNGTLELLRPHNRVVRGISVERDQIAAAIAQHPAVTQAAIVDRMAEDLYLDAYVVLAPDANLTIDELHHFLRPQLPYPLLPKHLVMLSGLPLTPTGEVDRAALLDPAQPAEKSIVSFRDDIEQQLTQLWESVLEIGSIDVQDKLF
ncbi:MAG: AMP-binding protein [Leptolyngbyaceae cyanobacterium SM1_3_5]|nr:AMP-binding protein [Leptolyngbyaceae cyanobacterium SM1_3_5]